MPSRNAMPIPAFGARVDARDFDGANFISLDGGSNYQTWPSFDLEGGEGIYDEPVMWACGYGSQVARSVGKELDGAWSAAGKGGNISSDIGPDDLVRVRCTGGGAETFSVTGSANNVFGFRGTVAAVSDGAGGYVATATHNWTRGLVDMGDADTTLSLAPGSGGGPYTAPTLDGWCLSVPTLLRARSSAADLDDIHASDCLEARLNAKFSAVVQSVRVAFTADGRLTISAPTSVFSSMAFASAAVRAAIGASGNETTTTANSYRYWTADYYFPGLLIPTRTWRGLQPESLDVGSAVRSASGALSGTNLGSFRRWAADFYLDGPADLRDLHMHYVQRCAPHWVRGRSLAVWQEWGDPRRALDPHEVTADQPPYDTLYTSERGGYQGRRRLVVSADAAPARQVRWPGKQRQRAPVSLLLEDSVLAAR